MRLFLAIELACETIAALDRALAPLRVQEPTLAWVAPEHCHLSLKLLGDVEESSVGALAGAMDSVAVAHRPFAMILFGVHALPTPRQARVVGVGVEHGARLELLQHDIETATSAIGYGLEGRPFLPRIILAKIPDPQSVARSRAVARAARRIHFSVEESVAEISLLESTIGAAGAPYRRLHAASLGGR